MGAKIEIVFDGVVPGLPEHRLSLASFGHSLKTLVAAVRRIASDLENKSADDAHSKGSRGRLAADAAIVDVQISAITSNSPITISADVVFCAAPSRPLIEDLPDRAAEVFLDGIRREASNQWANAQSRKFLRSLPRGLTTQTYRLRKSDGAVSEEFSIGPVSLPVARSHAHLIEVSGQLSGIGFESGHGEVRMRAESGEAVVFDASDELVELALSLRRQNVLALGVIAHTRPRLIQLYEVSRTRKVAPDRHLQIMSRWRSVLERLAQ